MDLEVRNIVENLAATYRGMLDTFLPCKPGKEFLEQNIITLLAHEYLKLHPTGSVFTELPFISSIEKNHWSARLDAFFFTEELGYLIEVKGSQERDRFFQLIEDDVIRLTSNELKLGLREMFQGEGRNNLLPKKFKGLVLGDCWYKSQSDRWVSNSKMLRDFDNVSMLDTMSIKIGDFGGYEYFLLAGQIVEEVDV